MNEQDNTPVYPEDPNDIELEEEDAGTSNVVGRHDTEPVNDFDGTGFAIPEVAAIPGVSPEDFADPVVRDAVQRAGDEWRQAQAEQLAREAAAVFDDTLQRAQAERFAVNIIDEAVRKAQVEKIRKEDLGITVDGGFVPSGPVFEKTDGPLGFIDHPEQIKPLGSDWLPDPAQERLIADGTVTGEPIRSIPVAGLPQLDSQLDFDRSVEALRREFRQFLGSSLVGYGSVAAKNRATDYMTDSLIRMIEPKYHAVWQSADYFKSTMESWKRAAKETEQFAGVPTVAQQEEAVRGFLGSTWPDDGLDRPPLSNVVKVAGDDFVYLSLPKHEIPSKVAEYVSAMETQRTNEWCKCQWIVHPDDVDLPAHGERKRRMRRGDTHPQCAVHTKEGFILGFFEWYFRDVPESEEDTGD